MFIPFSDNEIDAQCNSDASYVALDVTVAASAKKYMVCNKIAFGTRFLASFQLLDNADLGCIVNFSLHESREGSLSEFRHLYLTMALRCVRKWAVSNDVDLLCIHTEDPLMPEIFLNEGLTLRKSTATNKPLYRGSLQLKE
jgi:hypothetical protein